MVATGLGPFTYLQVLAFAMPIVVAIIAGRAEMLIYKDEIVQWISNRGYLCVACGRSNWEA